MSRWKAKIFCGAGIAGALAVVIRCADRIEARSEQGVHMRHTNPTLDSQDLVPHSMPGSPVSIYPASTRLSRIKIDTVVAVLCSTVLCLSTARVMVASQWPATPEARPPAVDIELDSDGDELFLKVSTIEISTPMVVHSV